MCHLSRSTWSVKRYLVFAYLDLKVNADEYHTRAVLKDPVSLKKVSAPVNKWCRASRRALATSLIVHSRPESKLEADELRSAICKKEHLDLLV